MVISADLIAIGDHVGRTPAPNHNAARPATWGADSDVPERKPKSCPSLLGGATAPRIDTPGATRSGLRVSPPVPTEGPRAENVAICG